jgi:perosamine synthetase
MAVSQIEDKINKKTKAIFPVHIYGHPCDMDPIIRLARKYKLSVIEDAAEAHGAEYKGRKIGSFGDVACFSFYGNKIITTGEGGMVVTNNKSLAKKARILKDLAFSPKKRFLHIDIGFNYRMTNLQAAIGLAQLEKINKFVESRRRNAYLYNQYLKGIKGLVLPVEKEWAKNVYWMYGVLVDREFGMTRNQLRGELLKKGIETRDFFIPLHRQPICKKMRLFHNESYPCSEKLSQQGFYLPSSSKLKKEEIQFIAQAIKEIQNG